MSDYPAGTILVAKESGTVILDDGERFEFVKGVTRINADIPLAKKAAHLLEPLDGRYDVERMTAWPGERRGEPQKET